jgi:betaine-aldehyde dehydrogenase
MMDKPATRLSLPESPREFGFHVDGAYVPAGGREVFTRHSPGHGIPVTRMVKCTGEDLDAAVTSARRAFEDRRWSGLSGGDRSAVLLKAAEVLRARTEEVAYWETLENGKPIAQARAEVQGCVSMFEFAAGLARALHGDSFNNLGDGMFGIVTREPVGVVGIITPWNFPFLILCERVPLRARRREHHRRETLRGDLRHDADPGRDPDRGRAAARRLQRRHRLGPDHRAGLIEHMDVDMLSFTGSTAVGRTVVRRRAGRTSRSSGSSLAARTPRSSSPTPISRTRPTAWPSASASTPGSAASRARG